MKHFLFAALIAVSAVAPARACSYVFVMRGDTSEVALRELPAVFVGRVIRVELIRPDSLASDFAMPGFVFGYRATFAVTHAWTGPKDTIAIDWWSNCEVAFEIGRKYVVFAEQGWSEIAQAEVLMAPIWWPTAPFRESYDEVSALNDAAIRLRKEGLDVEPWKR